MKSSPYETFTCVGYELEKIVLETQRELTVGSHSSMNSFDNATGNVVFGLFSNITFNPKPFAHPIDIVKNQGRGDWEEKLVLVDLRPFTKVSKISQYDVTKVVEYDLARRRGVLHSIWSTSDGYLVQNVCGPMMQIYCAWISESISRHLNIDTFTQQKIANIAGWWWWCQSNTKEELTEVHRARIYREIAEATRSSYDTVSADLEGIEYFDDLEVFCNEVKERTGGNRIKHLDPASVVQLSAGSWMGTWAREIMAVSIEYPPYFISVVYTAMHERGTRSAPFSKLVQRFLGRPELKGFKESVERMVNTI